MDAAAAGDRADHLPHDGGGCALDPRTAPDDDRFDRVAARYAPRLGPEAGSKRSLRAAGLRTGRRDQLPGPARTRDSVPEADGSPAHPGDRRLGRRRFRSSARRRVHPGHGARVSRTRLRGRSGQRGLPRLRDGSVPAVPDGRRHEVRPRHRALLLEQQRPGQQQHGPQGFPALRQELLPPGRRWSARAEGGTRAAFRPDRLGPARRERRAEKSRDLLRHALQAVGCATTSLAAVHWGAPCCTHWQQRLS